MHHRVIHMQSRWEGHEGKRQQRQGQQQLFVKDILIHWIELLLSCYWLALGAMVPPNLPKCGLERADSKAKMLLKFSGHDKMLGYILLQWKDDKSPLAMRKTAGATSIGCELVRGFLKWKGIICWTHNACYIPPNYGNKSNHERFESQFITKLNFHAQKTWKEFRHVKMEHR
jgi:hypothetical protein